MIAQLLHQANLSLLLNWLVSRSILAHTESIVRPDKLDGNTHQCCQADSGLHIVGEHEERATSCNTAVQRHTNTHVGHGQFGYTSLEECSTEVTLHETMSLLEESISLVGITQVGRSADHIGHLLGQFTQTSRRSSTSGNIPLLNEFAEVYLRSLAREPVVHL